MEGPKDGHGGPPVSGTGIGVLGAKKSVVKHNSVLSNRPAQPGAPFAGGIVVASTKPLGGSAASKNRILENHALKNKPADIVWDGQGNGNNHLKQQRNIMSEVTVLRHERPVQKAQQQMPNIRM